MQPEDHILIEEYLDGRLSQEARTALEARLATDEELAQALALRRDMDRHLRKREKRAQLKTTLGELGEEFFQVETPNTLTSEAKRIPLHRRWYAYAAAIALVVTMSIVLYLNLRPGLYDQYAQHTPLALTAMSADSDALAARAETAFNAEDYETAYATLQQYLASNETNSLARLYLGISALETERIDEAIIIFAQMKEKTGNQFADYAQWYLALAHLKSGNTAACKVELRQIREDSEWFDKAQELLINIQSC